MNRRIHCAVAFGLTLLLLTAASRVTCAQDTSGGQSSPGQSSPGQSSPDQSSPSQGANDQNSGAAPAATGLDTQTEMTENPPVSGLDQPSFEPGFGARSYLVPRLQGSESVQNNSTASVTSPTGVGEITRVLGSLDLQKLWKIHPLNIDYIGGGTWFNSRQQGWYQVHSMSATQRILWRTGQLAIRDQFSYLPQGSFGFGSFGGSGGLGGLGGGGGFGGSSGGLGLGGGAFGGTFGTNGNSPRIDNVGMVDVTQALSPRATVVVMGGYGTLHFLNSPPGFINSQQIISQASYNYLLGRKDQIGISYGFQEFHFPTANAGDVNVNLWQVYYAHRISGHMDLSLGGGPQWIHQNGNVLAVVNTSSGPVLTTVPQQTSRISGAGRAGLTYRWSAKTNLSLNYFHYVTPGSGFYPGANTDTARFTFTHQLTRRWTTNLDTGFSRSTRILKIATTAPTASPAGNSNSYDYWYNGAGIKRMLSPHFSAFANYQYHRLLFGSGFCGAGNRGCRAGYGQQIGMVGLAWTPRPIRLD